VTTNQVPAARARKNSARLRNLVSLLSHVEIALSIRFAPSDATLNHFVIESNGSVALVSATRRQGNRKIRRARPCFKAY
jgi:hypothetical protein